MAIKFQYDKDGNLIVYKDGKAVGEMKTIGDEFMERQERGKTVEDNGKKESASGLHKQRG